MLLLLMKLPEAVIGGNASISDNATIYGKVMPW